ncbi:MAG TPA: sulfotransferase [Acidimicrobiia bacterium]|nr:sulfotransferase [Acidimicrobiia bacterium]
MIVFVGGVHRSGTTLVARALAAHPDASGLVDTGVPEDEGQHLQSVYPTGETHGGPGRFALDPAAHLTEADAGADHADRLRAAWDPYWDTTRAVLVEKSPPNLVRFRYLSAVFPDARFVAVVRHPVPVVLATFKMAPPDTSVHTVLRNWVVAHETFRDDEGHLARVRVVRYEDFVAQPASVLDELHRFVGLPPRATDLDIRPDRDAQYSRQWRAATGRASLRRHFLARRYDGRVRALGFGYSLRDLPGAAD